MSVGRISAFISLPVSAECGRMTQPYMIDAFSSNGLAHCPSYRLSAVRPELKKRRDLPADCTIPKKNSVTWLKQSEWKYKKHKYSTWAEVLKQGDPKSECSPWARLSCHPELGLLIMSLSLALVYHPSASHYWLNGLDRSGGGGGISAVWRDYAQSWDVPKVWTLSVFFFYYFFYLECTPAHDCLIAKSFFFSPFKTFADAWRAC